ncbi:MAG: hypothetical protein ACLPYS_13110, partial [Vulcanimicrobiaceae bacterium]
QEITMNRKATLFGFLLSSAALLTSVAPAPAAAPNTARFSSAPVYGGNPNLPTTLSMIEAGGGPSSFDSTKLVGVLAGAKTQAEVDSLTQKFGADNVKSFLTVFNFVVDDSLTRVTAAKVALPTTPVPSPDDGKALAAALYKLGVTPGGWFDVEYMLDGLVTHPIHVAVMDDIDKKYGYKADGNYHAVLTQAMLDLKSVYGL